MPLQLSRELEEKIKEFPGVDWSNVAEEAIRAKAFELRLSKSKELQKALLEALASKSKLTEKDALELGRKVNEGISKELKEKGLI
jgi:Zn-dependent peptidase ImmA (M78 family)|tara:strand:- start:1787 stop:2041 length:255 start_codon:yes stop_codon:yes gene_type:complete